MVISWEEITINERALLTDTEAREDPSQQIVRRKLPGDLAQILLRQTQLFRQQLARPRADQLRFTLNKVVRRLFQRLKVTTTRQEAAFHAGVKAHALLEMVTQVVNAFTGTR
jgi:hypothetical protein